MSCPEITDQQFRSDLRRLVATAEWQRIAGLPRITDPFNLFELLEDAAICENAWSRIISFLFDASANHGFGLKLLRWWAADNLVGGFSELTKSAKTSTCEVEWGTFEGRRLDMLIKLLNDSGYPIGVIGI